jgi:hypothetical protein
MLNHPDVQLQYILTTLENQRDNLMIENGKLSARNKELEAIVAALEPPKEDAPTEEGDGEPIA